MAAGVARADDESVAKNLVQTFCSNCHGKNGRSEDPTFPRLAGQQEDYLAAQLEAFKNHTRADPHAQAYMWGIASKPDLTTGVIKDIAKYYSEQTPVPGSPPDDPALSAIGKKLFMEGDAARKIPECAACHGTDGAGAGTIPRLAGQHRQYLVHQLQAFRDNTRENAIMHQNASTLTDADIEAIATYLASQ